MTKNEFINKLKYTLSDLPYSEVEKTIEFYSEIIDDRIEDGMTEESAVDCLPSIDSIANELKLEMPIPVLVKSKIKESHDNSKNQSLWMILAICGLPLWLPLGLAFILTIVSIYIAIWSIILAVFAVLFALAIAGLGGIVAGTIHGFVTGPITGLMIVGIGFICVGLFILSINPAISLAKSLSKSTVKIIKKVKGIFLSQKRGEIDEQTI